MCDGSLECIPSFITAGWDLLYPYTSDLLRLDACRPLETSLPPELSIVTTPLMVPAWSKALQTHRDQAFAQYVVNGLCHGFCIGFSRSTPLRSARTNMGYAHLHPGVVTNYIEKELSLGRMLGPFPTSFSVPELQINRFGVGPKGHNMGKWRLITDLSFHLGMSVNEGVDPCLC